MFFFVFFLKKGTASEWANVFYISGSLYIFGGIIYLIFGTSERQKWSQQQQTTIDFKEKDDRLFAPISNKPENS
jgi:hypothetical protein